MPSEMRTAGPAVRGAGPKGLFSGAISSRLGSGLCAATGAKNRPKKTGKAWKFGKAFGGIEGCGAWQQIDTAMSYGIARGGGAVGVLRRWRSAEILGSASLLVVPGCQSPFICRFSLCR